MAQGPEELRQCALIWSAVACYRYGLGSLLPLLAPNPLSTKPQKSRPESEGAPALRVARWRAQRTASVQATRDRPRRPSRNGNSQHWRERPDLLTFSADGAPIWLTAHAHVSIPGHASAQQNFQYRYYTGAYPGGRPTQTAAAQCAQAPQGCARSRGNAGRLTRPRFAPAALIGHWTCGGSRTCRSRPIWFARMSRPSPRRQDRRCASIACGARCCPSTTAARYRFSCCLKVRGWLNISLDRTPSAPRYDSSQSPLLQWYPK